MDLKSLGYFVAAVDTGSITAAAAQCFIAQPSITSAIKKLEEELGVTLLVRQKRGVTVTPDGAELYGTAKSLLQHAQSIKNRFNQKDVQQSITINVSHAIAFEYLQQLIHLLREQSDSLEVKVVRNNEDTEKNGDIRLTMEQGVMAHEEFIACWQDRYCLIIPNEHPLAFQKNIKVSDLNHQAFINRSFCDRSQLMVAFLNEHKIELNVVAEVENEEWALSMVESGLGISIVPLPNEMKKSPRFVIMPLSSIAGLQDFERRIGVAIDFKKYSNPYYQQLANRLKAAFGVTHHE